MYTDATISKGSIYSESFDRNCYRCGHGFHSYIHKFSDAKVCKQCRAPKQKAPPAWEALGKPLTFRHEQICRLIAQGDLNKEIAYKLGLTEGTVKVYISQIFARTGLTNRVQIAMWWSQKSDNSSKPE